MSPSKYYSQTSLVQAGDSMVDSFDTVSFDMFDTLVVRRIHNPDLVKLPVARFINSLSDAQGLNWTWQQIQQQRDLREKENRADTGSRFDDHEAHYPTFMSQMLRDVFADAYSEELLQAVTAYELKMENAMLVPRAGIVDWLKRLKAMGKQVLVVSDIYLPATHLEHLLDHAGILAHVDGVY